jgi:hypothetical protein
MARQFVLRENALTDNLLFVADKGKAFKGGYVAFVKEYTYQNPWSDKETIKKFRTKQTLLSHLNKNYEKETVEELDFTDTCLN